MTCQWIALAGPLQGQSIELGTETLTLGRHASNNLVIRQISVSRRHAELKRTTEGHLLSDLDSLHGTFVNDQAIQSRLLIDGDLVTVGESLFLYRDAEPASAHPQGTRPAASMPPVFEEATTASALDVAALALSGRPSVGDLESVQAKTAPSVRVAPATDALIGESESMCELRSLITRIADVASTVLIDGESGCGKELVARMIHDSGPRAGAPFIAVNCATLSETLLESELFGHEKGAFTGAAQQRIGQFERAHGGTIFLDEVGEIPLSLQAKLLRVLQERQIERLGGHRTIEINVRVLAATNRDLSEEISARRFRDDLFYRLNVIRLTIPPLRDRRSDIPLLAMHFLFHHARRLQRPSMALARATRAALLSYDWPGNVRELSNALERAVVLAQKPVLEPEDLPETVLECRPPSTPVSDYHGAVNIAKRKLILSALETHAGNVTQAARGLGLSPNYLHRLIANLGLRERLERSRKS